MNISNVICKKLSQDIDFIILPINEIENQQLHPEEEKYISSARLKRCKEFSAGRLGARQLLRRYGITDFPLRQGENGEPIWPEGIIGSIAHCDDYCIVITARTTQLKSLGVDVEPYNPLPRDVEELICTRAEKKWIESIAMGNDSIHWSKIIFSAKESAYKCIFPLVKRFIDFQEAEIKININRNTFEVQIPGRSSSLKFTSFFHDIKGVFIIEDQFLFTVAMMV